MIIVLGWCQLSNNTTIISISKELTALLGKMIMVDEYYRVFVMGNECFSLNTSYQ